MACGVGSGGAATVAAADQAREEAVDEETEEDQTRKRTWSRASEVGWAAPNDGAERDR